MSETDCIFHKVTRKKDGKQALINLKYLVAVDPITSDPGGGSTIHMVSGSLFQVKESYEHFADKLGAFDSLLGNFDPPLEPKGEPT